MAGEFGVTNFLKCADLVIEGGNIVGTALEDKTFSAADLGLFFNLIDELTALNGIDWKAIPKEITDFDAEDLGKIKTHFNAKFNIPQDNTEEIIEKVAAIVISLSEIGIDIYNLVQSFKKEETV